MKTFLQTLFFSLLVTQICFAQWEVLHQSLVGPMNAIDFVDENVGWIAGSNGTLEKTTDGGENWYKITINKNQHFDKIDFLNESIGWAIGGSFDIPVIRKTSDGGLTWFEQLTNIGFSDLYVIDENNVYAVGSGTIYKTTNGE